jgi:hypothetical protein
MNSIGTHLIGHIRGEPKAFKVFADLRPIFINGAALTDLTIMAPFVGWLIQDCNSRNLAAESAAATLPHDRTIFNAPAAI